MKALLIALALCVPALAQRPPEACPGKSCYKAYKETALVAAAEKITIQVPATDGKQVLLRSATIFCSAACTATITQNGSVASATALTPTTVNMSSPATISAFSSSNSTGGKVLDAVTIPAGSTVSYDLSDLTISAPGQNVSIGTDSITATVRIIIGWEERER